MVFNWPSSGPISRSTLSLSAARSSSLRLVGLQGAGQAQDSIQVGLAGERMLVARRVECGQIGRHQFAIVSGRLLRRCAPR